MSKVVDQKEQVEQEGILVVDIETNCLAPKRQNELDLIPVRCVQIAWQLHTRQGQLISKQSSLVQPDRWIISKEAQAIHGISQDQAIKNGRPLMDILKELATVLVKQTGLYVGHNCKSLDIPVLSFEFASLGFKDAHAKLLSVPKYCTMEHSLYLVDLPPKHPGLDPTPKWPTLAELYKFLFKKPYDGGPLHDAANDVAATAACFFVLFFLGGR